MNRSVVSLLLLFFCTANSSCPQDQLAVYKMIFNTEWSRERFPKQYPEWRPNAQWSKVIGETHNDSRKLWRMGEIASTGLKLFAETGRSEYIETENKTGLFDNFYAKAIKVGVGKTETLLFLDGNHTKVSIISRIVPSPDWFVGVDSFDLCSDGKWLDTVTLDLDPIDAGTENGFTFTAPKWSSNPPMKITQITSQFPNHQANSFFYPSLRKLPRIAYVQFVKTREYNLREVFQHDPNKNIETVVIDKPPPAYDIYVNDGVKVVKSPKENTVINSLKVKSNKKGRRRRPRNCRVSEWSEWSACNKSCGFGEKRRERKVLKHAARGGKPCPPLYEVHWCGSASNCRKKESYFSWQDVTRS